jgi:hypothetical protein
MNGKSNKSCYGISEHVNFLDILSNDKEGHLKICLRVKLNKNQIYHVISVFDNLGVCENNT